MEEPIVIEENKVKEPIVIQEAKEEIKTKEPTNKKQHKAICRVKKENKKKLTSFKRECAEKLKNKIPRKGKLAAIMLQGKPKHRCVYVFEDISFNREPTCASPGLSAVFVFGFNCYQ